MNYRIEHKIKKGREFAEQGKLLHAIQIFNSIIEESPGCFDAYFNLTEIYEKYNNIDAAIKVFETAIENNVDDPELNLAYGQLLIRTMNWEKAIQIFGKLSAEEKSMRSYFIGFANYMIQDFESDKLNFLQFIISDEQPEIIFETYLFISKINYELNQYEAALKFAKKAEALLNNYWELHLTKAKIYFRLNMLTHSDKSIYKAQKLNKNEKMINLWAGKIHLKNLELNLAEEYLLKFIEQDKKQTHEYLTEKCKKFLKAGKLKEAMFYYEQSEKAEEHLSQAHENLSNTISLRKKKTV